MRTKTVTKTKVPKEGIFRKKTRTGINLMLKQNQHILANLKGYNNNQNAEKGLIALYRLLQKSIAYTDHFGNPTWFNVIDLTAPKKKAVKSTTKKKK